MSAEEWEKQYVKEGLVAAILAIRSKFVTEASGFAASACSFRIRGKAAVML